jgi:hypothetical protein
MLWCISGKERISMCEFGWGFIICGIRDQCFYGESTTFKATSNKAVKYKKSCYLNQHVFICFAFDTLGFLTLEVVDLLHVVQMVIHKNVYVHKYCVL